MISFFITLLSFIANTALSILANKTLALYMTPDTAGADYTFFVMLTICMFAMSLTFTPLLKLWKTLLHTEDEVEDSYAISIPAGAIMLINAIFGYTSYLRGAMATYGWGINLQQQLIFLIPGWILICIHLLKYESDYKVAAKTAKTNNQIQVRRVTANSDYKPASMERAINSGLIINNKYSHTQPKENQNNQNFNSQTCYQSLQNYCQQLHDRDIQIQVQKLIDNCHKLDNYNTSMLKNQKQEKLKNKYLPILVNILKDYVDYEKYPNNQQKVKKSLLGIIQSLNMALETDILPELVENQEIGLLTQTEALSQLMRMNGMEVRTGDGWEG